MLTFQSRFTYFKMKHQVMLKEMGIFMCSASKLINKYKVYSLVVRGVLYLL